LLDYIDELESENSDLQDALDSIADDDDAVDNAAAADDY